MKEYLADVVNVSVDIANILNDEKMTNILTPENYAEDGPDFVETKQFLQESTEKIEQYKNEVLELLTNEKAMSYIENKDLDQYYIDLYKEIALSEDTALDEDNAEIEKSLNEASQILKTETEIINFLSENKGNWEVQGDNIVFNSEALTNQYNEYVSQLQ